LKIIISLLTHTIEMFINFLNGIFFNLYFLLSYPSSCISIRSSLNTLLGPKFDYDGITEGTRYTIKNKSNNYEMYKYLKSMVFSSLICTYQRLMLHMAELFVEYLSHTIFPKPYYPYSIIYYSKVTMLIMFIFLTISYLQ
jgi:hypothetical protein